MAPRRVIANSSSSAVDLVLWENDPEHGASRREGLLLVAYALLFVVGVWTVVVSELAPQDPGTLHPANVTLPTQPPIPPGK